MARRIIAQPYPLLVSAAVATVFTERLVFDQRVFGRYGSWWASIESTSASFCFLLCWLMVLASLLIDRHAMARNLRHVHDAWHRALHEALSPAAFALSLTGLLLIAFVRGARSKETVVGTLIDFARDIWTFALSAFESPEVRLVILLGGIYAIWRIIVAFLHRHERTVEEAIHETVISAIFIGVWVVMYLWLYRAVVFAELSGSVRYEALSGLVKDTAVYAVVTLGLVVGTYKAGETLRKLRTDIHRWLMLAVIALGTMMFALAAMLLDLRYKDTILRTGQAIEYPALWQQDAAAFHIVIRDFGLLVPLLILVFLRFFLEIERINLDLRAPGRA